MNLDKGLMKMISDVRMGAHSCNRKHHDKNMRR